MANVLACLHVRCLCEYIHDLVQKQVGTMMAKTWQERQAENRKIQEDRNKRNAEKRRKDNARKLQNAWRSNKK